MYFITAVKDDYDNRCVGYFKSLEKATRVLEGNYSDISESGYYPFAVIENVKEGIYQYDFRPLWFKYNKKINRFEPSDRPSNIANNIIGFGIG